MTKITQAVAMLFAMAVSLLGRAVASLLSGPPAVDRGILIVTHDGMAIKYRVGAGYAGTVNRTHPFSVEPNKIDTTSPPTGYGKAVIVNTAGDAVRDMAAGDTGVTKIYGVAVRPYPTQQESGGMSAAIGAATPPVAGVMDVLRYGYINVYAVGAAKKDGAVHLWIAASTGAHVQGTFESAASGGNTVAITNAKFNGPPDTNGITEIIVWEA